MLCNDYLAIFPQVANPGLSDKMIAHKPNMFLKQNKTSATPILRILTTEWYLEALSAIVKPYYMYISLPCKQIMMIWQLHETKSWTRRFLRDHLRTPFDANHISHLVATSITRWGLKISRSFGRTLWGAPNKQFWVLQTISCYYRRMLWKNIILTVLFWQFKNHQTI